MSDEPTVPDGEITAAIAGLYTKNGTLSKAKLRDFVFSGMKKCDTRNTPVFNHDFADFDDFGLVCVRVAVLTKLLGGRSRYNHLLQRAWVYDADRTVQQHMDAFAAFLHKHIKKEES